MASLNFQVNHPIDLKGEHILNRKAIQKLSVAQSMHLLLLNNSFVSCIKRSKGL